MAIAAALAASIALLVGFGAGYLQFAPGAGLRPAGADSSAFEAALYDALEREDFGAGVAYAEPGSGGSGTVTVLGAVATSGGMPCREFRHDWQDADGGATQGGVACRSAVGEWSVLVMPREPAR
jgi:surface antigen